MAKNIHRFFVGDWVKITSRFKHFSHESALLAISYQRFGMMILN
jgi:hypothetical protein